MIKTLRLSLYTGQKRDLSGVFILDSVGLKLLFHDVLWHREPILGTRVSYSGQSEVYPNTPKLTRFPFVHAKIA